MSAVQCPLFYFMCLFVANSSLCFLWLTFHVEGLHEEGPAVGELFDDLCGWLARAVARLRLDTDKHRSTACLRGLKRRGKLKAVSRPNTIVVIRILGLTADAK